MSNKTQHTPGPWAHHGTAGHEMHGQSAVYPENGGRDIAIVYDGEANAALIARAPDMDAALRAIRARMRGDRADFKALGYLWTDSESDDIADIVNAALRGIE